MLGLRQGAAIGQYLGRGAGKHQKKTDQSKNTTIPIHIRALYQRLISAI